MYSVYKSKFWLQLFSIRNNTFDSRTDIACLFDVAVLYARISRIDRAGLIHCPAIHFVIAQAQATDTAIR